MLKKCKDHVESVNETYFEHMIFALGFSGKLLFAGCAVLVHAICPALCQTTGSRMIFELNDTLRNRPSAHKHD